MSKRSFVLIAAVAVVGLLALSSRASNPEEERERAERGRRYETEQPPARRFGLVPPEDRPPEQFRAPRERELNERFRDRADRFRFDGRYPPHRPPHNPEFRELGRRLMHLHSAIENLHRAEFHEVAEDLTREAEKMEREIRRGPERRRERGVEQRPPQPPPIDEFRRMFDEMRDEIEKLKREVHDLRKAVTPKQEV